MELLAQTSFLGTTIRVYADRVEYKMLSGLAGTLTIPIRQIASVHESIIIFWEMVVETAGGKQYHLFVNPFRKRAVIEAVLTQVKKNNEA